MENLVYTDNSIEILEVENNQESTDIAFCDMPISDDVSGEGICHAEQVADNFSIEYDSLLPLEDVPLEYDKNKNDSRKIISGSDELQVHVITEETILLKNVCPKCKFRFHNMTKFKRHLENKHKMQLKIHCSKCDYESKLPYRLLIHFVKVHTDQILPCWKKKHMCSKCTFYTAHSNILKIHMKHKHEVPEPTTKSARRKHLQGTDLQLYQCIYCEYQSKRKLAFLQHFKLNHDPTTQMLKCSSCRFETKHQPSMDRHIKSHSNDSIETLKCSSCTFETKYETRLQHHVKLKHDESIEILYCSKCHYSTKDPKYLRKHLKVTHSDPIHTCHLCTYKFKYKRSLVKHFLANHDENATVFKCSHCSFGTKVLDNFNLHLRTRHSDSFEIFKCSRCEFSTKLHKCLKEHFKQVHLNK